MTTQQGASSRHLWAALTGRVADYLIVDDPLKSDEASSHNRLKSVNHAAQQIRKELYYCPRSDFPC